jgi:hypothetical protein
MRPEPYPVLPAELSDEATAALLELLQEIARVLESHIRRSAPARTDHPPELWPEQAPPF